MLIYSHALVSSISIHQTLLRNGLLGFFKCRPPVNEPDTIIPTKSACIILAATASILLGYCYLLNPNGDDFGLYAESYRCYHGLGLGILVHAIQNRSVYHRPALRVYVCIKWRTRHQHFRIAENHRFYLGGRMIR